MAEQRKAYLVGITVALVCSVLVSAAVVTLRPLQAASREKERVDLIISAAGADSIEKFRPLMVNLRTGTYEPAVDPEKWFRDYSRIIRDPATTNPVDKRDDIVLIRMVPREMLVYILYEDGKPTVAVLPVYGTGLWSVMRGYLAIDLKDMSVKGLRFNEHGETPGLGGEIDNPRWQARWVGKHIYLPDGKPAIKLVRTTIPGFEEYSVDTLSGATLTAVGVENMVNFWIGDLGYKHFLNNIARAAHE